MENEIKIKQSNRKKNLELLIKNNEKPSWYGWLGIYPAKASVEAAKTELNAINKIIDNNLN